MSPDEPFSRRRYLALAGGSLSVLAGCSGDGGGQAGSTRTTTATDTATPTDTTREMPTPTTRAEETATPTPTQGKSTAVKRLESQLATVEFDGEYIDTHLHWHGARDTRHDILDPQTLATQYGKNEIGASALFTSSTEVSDGYADVLGNMVTDDTEFLPFLEPYGRHLLEGTVTEVYEQHPDVFRGIGEIVFYGGAFKGTSLTADPWPKLFDFSASKDIPLMIHPTLQQESGLKTMLSDYPDATVLAHGGEYNLKPNVLRPILKNNDNLYWTLDAGSMLNGLVLRASDASDFADRYEQRKGEYHRLVENTLPWMMDAAPDRVMWGTDLATDWNTDPKVISRVMDWTQAALDSLPADQRDKYAYKNARNFFGI